MRRLPLVLLVLLMLLLLAGCGARAGSSGPAWPKSAGWVTPESPEEDGGESLEPRVAEAAALESAGETVLDPFPDPAFDPAIFDDPAFAELPTVEPPTPTPDAYVPEETIIIEGEPPP